MLSAGIFIGYYLSTPSEIYNEEITALCKEPESLLENCPECADKYFLVVESETFDFYVPYGSRELILGGIPANEKDCRIKVCIEYGFNFNEEREWKKTNVESVSINGMQKKKNRNHYLALNVKLIIGRQNKNANKT